MQSCGTYGIKLRPGLLIGRGRYQLPRLFKSYTVIQLVCFVRLIRPLDWGSRGRWFKSSRPDLVKRLNILLLAGSCRSILPHSIPSL